ncbi:Galactose/methyl galactoside import ATP-binding protein MglA [Thermotalea metallivorans]|uniref:Galactose/methyl galactoside import ATP-binding protein MglA n=2 Tax=Thermotalea metallivorans TaxID=520762 RepID=A0A140LEA4_9FIRM|nr:ABC transporter ATP-binding protein [Thermotalea metallivorans]KXG78879.1 Galactose/methyl galactoside import ATP-binding protein MglA [Thermotalea metallivorans]
MDAIKEHIDFQTVVVEMKNIVKKFGDFTANDHIDLKVHKGEIHALLGENGAGKSTLMNILYGLYMPTSGEIYIQGQKVDVKNPNVAIAHGIGMVHQHFMLVKPFTVAENIVLGMEPTGAFNKLNIKKAIEDVRALSEQYGLHVDPEAKIEDISVGMQQRVEILKALYRGAEILILDEPTAVLTPQEIRELIVIMKNLTSQGKSIIIITHKLKEIKACADYCTIIRRGKRIDTVDVSQTDENQLASMMVGREVSFAVEKGPVKPSDIVLKVEGLVVEDNRGYEVVKGLNLEVRAGEIVGIAGVDGNGQTELIEAITGLRKVKSGKVWINGVDITNRTPREIFEAGVSNIPEDRQKHGLVLDFTVAENMVLENYRKEPFSKGIRLNYDKIRSFAEELMEKFDVRPRNKELKARALSGGNQQKVIIAREVTNDPDLLIAAQPTRGLDVGAIEFVHRALVDQRDRNKAVLLVSFELDEIMNVSDRISVIYEGKIVGTVNAKETDENELGLMMAGGGR